MRKRTIQISVMVLVFLLLGCSVEINPTRCEINVKQGNTNIPSDNGLFDFGNIPLGFSQNITFTIENTGKNDLELMRFPLITILGTNKADFIASTNNTKHTIEPGTSTDFSITFLPNATGKRTATVEILNNDGDENPYTFVIVGTCTEPAPEIHVKQGSNDIMSIKGTYDFGLVDVDSMSRLVIFTIENNGNEDLKLTGNPNKIGITSVDASMFTIYDSSTLTTISSGDSTSFRIAFNPTSSGIKTAKITILNNDSDENPYVFNVYGTGVAVPEIVVKQDTNNITTGSWTYDFGNLLVYASSSDVIFSIENVGTAALHLSDAPNCVKIVGSDSAMFSVNQSSVKETLQPGESTTFSLKFSPTSAGQKSATISIANNDEDENPFTFSIRGNSIEPEINVKQGTTNIPNSTGSFDFGLVYLGSYSAEKTFTIENLGLGNLKLKGKPKIAISGTDAAMFTINQSSTTSPIVYNLSTTFTIRFVPTTDGNKSATISIVNNDTDENPYTFSVTGKSEIPYPEINVKQGSTNIPNITGSYDFGSITIHTFSQEIEFKIENIGNANLLLTGNPKIQVSGSNSSYFIVNQSSTSSPVTPSSNVTFSLKFYPTNLGNFSATISIANNDTDENPYVFIIKGVGKDLDPEINIKQGSSSIPNSSGSYNFGTVYIGTSSNITTFTIENLAQGDLYLIGTPKISISGSDSAMFTINQTATTSPIAYGNSTTFSVQFTPSSEGNKDAIISIANNDTDENPYTFEIEGRGEIPYPDIYVKQDAHVVHPGYGYIYDFGFVKPGEKSINRIFSIGNSGHALLILTGSPKISISGTNASEFVLVQTMTTSPISPGNFSTFEVQFCPTSVGEKSAIITIPNNDPLASNYYFNISGCCYTYSSGLALGAFGGNNNFWRRYGSFPSNTPFRYFDCPSDVCQDSDGNLYIAEFDNPRISKWDKDGVTVGWIGGGSNGWKTALTYTPDGTDYQSFNYPGGICLDSNGNIYITDSGNDRVCKWDRNGIAIGWIGGGSNGWKTGTAPSSGTDYQSFDNPSKVFVDSNGNIYITDSGNNRVCKWDSNGNAIGWIGGGSNGWKTTNAPSTYGRDYQSFRYPSGIFVDTNGDLYITDLSYRVCKWTTTGNAVGWIGGGSNGWKTTDSSSAYGEDYQSFSSTFGVFISSGYLYVSDTNNDRVCKWNVNGTAIGWIGGDSDGWKTGTAPSYGSTYRSFNSPYGLFVNNNGEIFVSDSHNHRICKWLD